MFERCLNEAELILRNQKEPMTPVHEVWGELNRRSKVKGFDVASLADFSAMLEGDKRFQIIPASIKSQEDGDIVVEDELADVEMEDLGFYSEDRVKLRARRNVENPINEDEEEVGSIKRRAFVSQTKGKNIDVKKKTNGVVKKLNKKVKRSKSVQGKQIKSRLRKK